MASQDRTGAFALAGGVVLSLVTLTVYALSGSDESVSLSLPGPQAPAAPAPDEKAPAALARVKVSAAPEDGQSPAALRKPPTRLALEAYELTPATFLAWKDYVLGDPRNRLWQRIAWRTTLWDAVVDAHEQDKPILLEIHGGNALGRC